MTMQIPSSVLLFAGKDNLGVYEDFRDYWHEYRTKFQGAKNLSFATHTPNEQGEMVPISFDEKEAVLNAALKREIMRIAGIQNFADFPLETWASHPVLRWAEMAVLSALIDMILPSTLVDTIGLYSDIRSGEWGSSFSFDVEPRDLFVVSKAGRGKRTTEMKKQYRGQVVINPEPRQITVGVSLFRVLSGKESLAVLISKAIRSIETAITVDVYNAFVTAMAALSTGAYGTKVAGFTATDFTQIAQKVAAWNGGAKPVCLGTLVALASVVPAD